MRTLIHLILLMCSCFYVPNEIKCGLRKQLIGALKIYRGLNHVIVGRYCKTVLYGLPRRTGKFVCNLLTTICIFGNGLRFKNQAPGFNALAGSCINGVAKTIIVTTTQGYLSTIGIFKSFKRYAFYPTTFIAKGHGHQFIANYQILLSSSGSRYKISGRNGIAALRKGNAICTPLYRIHLWFEGSKAVLLLLL